MKKIILALTAFWCLSNVCLAQIERVQSRNVKINRETVTRVKYKKVRKNDFFALGEASIQKNGSAGFKMGLISRTQKKWGGYIGLDVGYGGAFSASLGDGRDLSANEKEGYTAVYELPDRTNSITASVGLIKRITKPFSAYLGLGIARVARKYTYFTYSTPRERDGFWCEYYPCIEHHIGGLHGYSYSAMGLGAEIGAMFRYKVLLLSAGYNTIARKLERSKIYGDFHVGLGLIF